MSSEKKVALLGTMDTPWREMVVDRLRDQFLILDNRDSRWDEATTAEEMEELVAKDLMMMYAADVVLWHHDAEVLGHTARIELGYLACLADHQGRDSVIHVEEPVFKREYMRALAMHHPRMHWADSWDFAVQKVRNLLKG
jgi:hypothetical protein